MQRKTVDDSLICCLRAGLPAAVPALRFHIACRRSHTLHGKGATSMKKTWAGLFLFLLLLYNTGVGRCEQTSAAAAYVMERTTGRTLLAVNADQPLPMASTTKVMTALLALENGNLDEPVTAGDNAYGVPGTSIYLQRGESMTLEQMLYGLMLASGNDAAVAIAEHIGGTVEAFCALMTARAAELGATNTRFSTPHGLPAENHYTTARDLAHIAAAAMGHPVFRQIVSTRRASIPWQGHDELRVLNNKNALLSSYEGATGIKTGYTRAAGRCLVFGAQRGEMELVGVVLNCPDWFDEAARLMDLCFARYPWTQAKEDGAAMGTLPVDGGTAAQASVRLLGALGAPLAEGETAQLVMDLPESVTAPQPAGTQVGWALLQLDGETVARRPVVLAEAVEKAPSGWERVVDGWPMLR